MAIDERSAPSAFCRESPPATTPDDFFDVERIPACALEDVAEERLAAQPSCSRRDQLSRLIGGQGSSSIITTLPAAISSSGHGSFDAARSRSVRMVATAINPGVGPRASRWRQNFIVEWSAHCRSSKPEQRRSDRRREGEHVQQDVEYPLSRPPRFELVDLPTAGRRDGHHPREVGNELVECRCHLPECGNQFRQPCLGNVCLSDIRKAFQHTDEWAKRHRLQHFGADAFEPAASSRCLAQEFEQLDFPMPAAPDTTMKGAPSAFALSQSCSSQSAQCACRPARRTAPGRSDGGSRRWFARSPGRRQCWLSEQALPCLSSPGAVANSKNPSMIRRVVSLTHTVFGFAAVSMRFATFTASPTSPSPISAPTDTTTSRLPTLIKALPVWMPSVTRKIVRCSRSRSADSDWIAVTMSRPASSALRASSSRTRG